MTPESRAAALGDCRDPRHREIFLAVVVSTKTRSDTRKRQANRDEALRALYERHGDVLKKKGR